MDKLDKTIKESKYNFLPDKNFVDLVMKRVEASQPKQFSWLGYWPAFAGGTMAVMLLAVFVVLRPFSSNQTFGNTKTPIASQIANNQSQPSQDGNDNSSLNASLNDINNGLSQGDKNLNNTDATINDQNQQIAVPTD